RCTLKPMIFAEQGHSMSPQTESVLAQSRIAIVGAGVMAESIVTGLVTNKTVTREQIVASHPRHDRRTQLAAKHGIRVVESNAEAVAAADLVLLTIKPQVMHAVMEDLASVLEPGQTVISIAAGT